MFEKVDGYIRKYGEAKYRVSIHSNEKYDFFDRIKYLIMLKINIPYVYFHKYAKIKVNSDNSDDSDDLPLKKEVIMHNVIIFIKSVFNENHKHYFYKVYLEKCSYI